MQTNTKDRPASGTVGSTILIIDDSSDNLRLAATCLSGQGYRVLIAQDGEEGLMRAKEAHPDLILLDVMMPGQDGFEICCHLKQSPITRDIPVIFMTALADSTTKVAGFNAGAADYVTKPLQLDVFVARVRTHLHIAALRKEVAARNELLLQYGANLEQQVERQTAELRASSRRLQIEVAERKQEFHSLVELSPDTIARYDRHCRRTYANPALVKAMGGNLDIILGVTPAQFPGGETGLAYQQKLIEVIESGEQRDFELRWTSLAGEACTHIRMTPEFDLAGDVVQILAVGRDITDIDRYRKKIYQQAFFDPLTGLPNRQLLTEQMQKCMHDHGTDPAGFSLLTLDLDKFKEVNDTRGHAVGDRILCETARRLNALAKQSGAVLVARLGGDEFAFLAHGHQAAAETIACRIKEALRPPFIVDGSEFFISASIGVARYPEDSPSIDGLYRFADLAMHHAKELGRDTFQVYTQELSRQMAERVELEAELRRVQEREELALYFQPQVDIQTGRMIGAEALLRWRRPGHGMVPPDSFIPVAEASGLIVGIGEWVIAAACRAAAAWNLGRMTPLRMAVNLSTRQFVRNDLAASILRILNETGCRPEWLKLEITESLLLEDSAPIQATLQALDRIGLALSIDDFGTGYSSLAYLNRFPVSQLKIDRSFVRGIPAARDKCELVKAMLSISSALQMETVAEGVETPLQAEFLRSLGCRYAQGYLYGAPMPRTQFEQAMTQAHAHELQGDLHADPASESIACRSAQHLLAETAATTAKWGTP